MVCWVSVAVPRRCQDIARDREADMENAKSSIEAAALVCLHVTAPQSQICHDREAEAGDGSNEGMADPGQNGDGLAGTVSIQSVCC